MVNDSIVVEVIFNHEGGTDTFGKQLLSEERYYGNGDKLLKKYKGFDLEQFKLIIADSAVKWQKYKGSNWVKSVYKYKPLFIKKPTGSYNRKKPLAVVSMKKVSFDKAANFAIIVISYFIGPDWGTEKAYFLKKEDHVWKIVGQNLLSIS